MEIENHEFEFKFYTILESPISRTFTSGNKFDRRGNAILPFPEYKSQKELVKLQNSGR